MPNPVNINNLPLIKLTPSVNREVKNILLNIINVQSIGNKEDRIRYELLFSEVDVSILTETWYENLEDDKARQASSPLNIYEYRLRVKNRKEGRGGGIALVARREYGVNAVQTVNTMYFESQVWKVQISDNCHWRIVGVYRPTYSNRNDNAVARFLDTFTPWTVNIITKFSNVAIAGDFNLHVDREDDSDAMTSLGTIEALGLEQPLKEPAHRSGNIIDLVIIEPSERIK